MAEFNLSELECIDCTKNKEPVYHKEAIKEFIKKIEISPEELHKWYLDATKMLNPRSFNHHAQKPFEELTEEQKFIDKYIANKINKKCNKLAGDELSGRRV